MEDKKYSEMNKLELIEQCCKNDSKIQDLVWKWETEKKMRLFDNGLCPMNKTSKDTIIACVYECEDCEKRRR